LVPKPQRPSPVDDQAESGDIASLAADEARENIAALQAFKGA
jgi:hypothetical protein